MPAWNLLEKSLVFGNFLRARARKKFHLSSRQTEQVVPVVVPVVVVVVVVVRWAQIPQLLLGTHLPNCSSKT